MTQIAQFNIGRLRAPLDSPEIAGFVAGLEQINRLADAAPGFVWRLTSPDADDATALRPYDDPSILLNCSVWESLEALREFVYRTGHMDFLRRRRDWFERLPGEYMVLWWVPDGHRPEVAEGMERLDRLRRDGPSTETFTFRSAPRVVRQD